MNCFLTLCLFSLSATFFGINVEAALTGEGIVGGDIVTYGDFPYQVSLQVSGRSMCGGSIIDDTHIITAAHCLINANGRFYGYSIKVVGGINYLPSKIASKVVVDVLKVYVPVEYDPTNEYKRPVADIAVLKLNKPLGIASNRKLDRIKLPTPSENFEGKSAMVSGFGWSSVDVEYDKVTGRGKEVNGNTLGQMRYAKVDILTYDTCRRLAEDISIKHTCGMVRQRSPKPEGVCSGDSGGPLVANGKTLIGVVNSSPLGCQENVEPGIYTNVSQYIDFIQKAIMDKPDVNIRTMTFRIY